MRISSILFVGAVCSLTVCDEYVMKDDLNYLFADTHENMMWPCRQVVRIGTFSLQVSIGGSVVEFSPTTRETRVRFPANAAFLYCYLESTLAQLRHVWMKANKKYLVMLTSKFLS